MDHGKTPGMKKILNEHGILLESLITLILEGLRGQGRGMTNTMKPKTAEHYKYTAQKLVYLAVQNDIIADAASIIADVGSLDSKLRGPFIAIFEDANDSDASKFGLVTAKHNLQRLRSIITVCGKNPVESATATARARSEVQAAEYTLKQQLSTKMKNRKMEMTYKSIGDQLVDEDGEPALLPAAMLVKDAPKLSERLKVHAVVLKAMVLKLREMEKKDVPLIMSRYKGTTGATSLVFKCMFLMSSAILPQRKTPWQTAMFGKPQSPWTKKLEVKEKFVEKSPVYLYYHDIRKQWGLTQLRTKDSSRPWMPFPSEMNELISLYLGRLHAGYTSAGIRVEGSTVFPSCFNKAYSNSGFTGFETGGFKKLQLQGATVMNARHAVALQCLDLGINPSSIKSDVADSIAAGMGTTTKHMFGEHFQGRAWGRGAYSEVGEADRIRRAQAGSAEYWSWVFPKRKDPKKRKRALGSDGLQ